MIFLPSRGRPQNVIRFFDAYRATEATEPGLIILDADDAHNYWQNGIELPDGWRFIAFDHDCIVASVNQAFAKYPDEDFYAVMADDVIPRTKHWDRLLREAAGSKGLAWGFDGGHAHHLPCHPFIGGELVRAMGWISYPGVKHFAADDVWLDIGLTLGSARYLPGVILEHAHPAVGKAQTDETYRSRPDQRADQEAYLKFHDSGEFLKLVTRLTDELFPESRAAKTYRPDTSPATATSN